MVIFIIMMSLLAVFTGSAWPVTYAINAGGPTYTDHTGQVYDADMGYCSGSIDHETPVVPIANTDDDPLYQSWRWGPSFAYALPIANGVYQVTLRFSENVHSQAGQRVFTVKMEGLQVLRALDVVAAAGASQMAYDVTRLVTVRDGVLDLAFQRITGHAMVSAIVVTTAAEVTLSWQAVEGATGYRVYQSIDAGVSWDPNPVADVSAPTATIPAPTSGLVLYRASAYNPSGETVRTQAGAWVNQGGASSEGPSLGIR